ncbi:NUDIX hydrolase [Burkholderia gladioli]|uniref:NUDIX hydrolase n=1 Tax=Burkholderia gladioli TaxID=28095 RepID=UPI00163E07D5|nr:NUDIX hydrolase [Burkholderia gladioli]
MPRRSASKGVASRATWRVTRFALPRQRATVVCRRGGRVLLVTRDGSRWALPGGSLEPGESAFEAACRELREETRLAGLPLAYAMQFGGLRKLHHVFLVDLPPDAHPRPGAEIGRCRWFSPRQVANLSASVPTREIVALLGGATRIVFPLAPAGAGTSRPSAPAAAVSPPAD